MSFTLRGRLETRLAAAVVPVLAAAGLAAALRGWWPLELAGLMIGTGLVLDAAVYHRLLPYQPGWVALPLALLELLLVMGLVAWLVISAPPGAAVAFFVGSWLLGQILVHAAFPLWRLSYGDDGGELGAAGAAAVGVSLAVLAFAGGVAWAQRPPTVHLSAGFHRGPLVIDRREHLIGEPGAVVQGGIVIRASDVLVRGVTVLGGENGIDVDGVSGIVLDHVTVIGASLDGIHVRRSGVVIRDCSIDSRGRRYGQGIDISYALDFENVVEGCTVVGGQEGIVTHAAMAMLRENRVSGTSMRGLTMTEMSMGAIQRNRVDGVLGVGIFCGDHSECHIERNDVLGTRRDPSGDPARAGVGILAHSWATAKLRDNRAGRVRAFSGGQIEGR